MSDTKKYDAGDIDAGNLICAKCNERLVTRSVTLSYMNAALQADLPACPGCGMVYIPEDLAKGRMLHVEQSLEDK